MARTSPERQLITFGDRGFAAGRRTSKCGKGNSELDKGLNDILCVHKWIIITFGDRDSESWRGRVLRDNLSPLVIGVSQRAVELANAEVSAWSALTDRGALGAVCAWEHFVLCNSWCLGTVGAWKQLMKFGTVGVRNRVLRDRFHLW